MKNEFFPGISNFLDAARDFLLPDVCCICGEITQGFLNKEKIFIHINGKRFYSPYCKNCTKDLGRAFMNSHARSKELDFYTVFLFDYSHETTKHVLYHLKHHRCKKCRHFFADILSTYFEKICDEDTVITYIPRNSGNFKKIGFDQSDRILSSYISNHPSSKYAALFERKNIPARDTEQKFLDYTSRKENARATLVLTKNADIPEKVLLFDDMITTGATLSAASQLLYAAGTKHISAVALAARIRDDQ